MYDPTRLEIKRENGTLYFSIDYRTVFTSTETHFYGDWAGFYNNGKNTVVFDDVYAQKW